MCIFILCQIAYILYLKSEIEYTLEDIEQLGLLEELKHYSFIVSDVYMQKHLCQVLGPLISQGNVFEMIKFLFACDCSLCKQNA